MHTSSGSPSMNAIVSATAFGFGGVVIPAAKDGHGTFVDLTVDGGRPDQAFGVKDAGHHQADVDAVGREFQTQGVECCP